MTELIELLSPSRCKVIEAMDSKKQIFTYISQLIQKDHQDTDSEELLTGFIAREKLGSTAIGHGVAIPHIRLGTFTEPVAALIRLKKGLEFDAPDSKPVDLIFALVVNQGANTEHLQILAKVAKLFSIPSVRQSLRECQDNYNLYQQLMSYEQEPIS